MFKSKPELVPDTFLVFCVLLRLSFIWTANASKTWEGINRINFNRPI